MAENTTGNRTQNALLTSAHRQFLPEQENYFTGDNAAQMRSEKRREIVDRVRHGLLDFELLFRHLRPAEIEEIFGEGEVDIRGTDRVAQHNIAFLLLGFAEEFVLRSDAEGTTVSVEGGHVSPEFEDALEGGLRLGYRRLGYLLKSARLDVISEGPVEDLDNLLEKLDAGTASQEEILYVLQTIDLPTEQIQDSVLQAIKDHSDTDYTAD